MQHHITATGDPARAAFAIRKLAGEPRLPLRVQLGSDAVSLVAGQARKTLSDLEEWRSVGCATDADDADADALDKVTAAVR